MNYPYTFLATTLFCATLHAQTSAPSPAAPLTIDLTREVTPPGVCPYGPGTTKDPQGRTITADTHWAKSR